MILIQVKTNVGHSEGASGLTSVIKVALAFEHGRIPPTYGVRAVNATRKKPPTQVVFISC